VPARPTPAHRAWWQDRPQGSAARLPADWPNLGKYLQGLPGHLEKCYPDDPWAGYLGDARLAAERAGYVFGKTKEAEAVARRLEVGAACVFLATPNARAMTGSTLYVDAGYNIVG